MLLYLFTAFTILSNLQSLTGVWVIPNQEFHIVMVETKEGNFGAEIVTNPKCEKKVSIMMVGKVEKKNGDSYFAAVSNPHKIDKGCNVVFGIYGFGNVIVRENRRKFNVKAKVISSIKCPDSKKVLTDDLSGTWFSTTYINGKTILVGV